MEHRTSSGRAWFLAKTDPETYSIEHLEREGRTLWDGVSNPQAVRTIREMREGDRVLVYHSGGESAIVGLAEVVGAGRSDAKNPKLAVADFQFLCRVEPPVTLREIKESEKFQDWALVRQGRLSTMTVPGSFMKWIQAKRPEIRF